MKKFYLSTHDYITSPEPRECFFEFKQNGKKYSNYILVKISPPLPKDSDMDKEVDKLLLHFYNEAQTIDDIGKQIVMVNIFVPYELEKDENLWDEKKFIERIGTGKLHGSYEEALRDSPI